MVPLSSVIENLPPNNNAYLHTVSVKCRDRLHRYIPITKWLSTYNYRENLASDCIAGFTVALMIIPQEVSLANVMHVPPVYGLYTAAFAPLIYAFLGTSRVLSVANAAEVSLLVGKALENIETPEERVLTGILLSFYIGLILLVMGSLRLGVLVDFFSKPVMGGFISAGGILIIFSQLKSLSGIGVRQSDFLPLTIVRIFQHLEQFNWASSVLGILSIGVLFGLKFLKTWLTKSQSRAKSSYHMLDNKSYVYSIGIALCNLRSLIICLIGIGAGHLFSGIYDIPIVGSLPHGLPELVFPWRLISEGHISWTDFGQISINAFMIAVIVYLSSIAMAKRMAGPDHSSIDASQEYFALGITSVVTSFLQAMPPTGAMSRTAVNAQNAQTQLASIITSLVVIVVLLFLTDPLAYLPKTTLAAIVMVAASSLIDLEEAKWLYQIRRPEFYIWLAGFIATLCVGVINGLIISIAISFGYALWQLKHQLSIQKQPHPSAVVVVVTGNLFFGNSVHLLQQLEGMANEEAIILEFSNVYHIDATALAVLEEFVRQHSRVAFTNVDPEIQKAFAQMRKTPSFSLTTAQALEYFRSHELHLA